MSENYDADGNKIPHRPRWGTLDDPEFGALPKVSGGDHAKLKSKYRSNYTRHLKVLRDHPGQWAKVFEVKISRTDGAIITRKVSLRKVTTEKYGLIRYLRTDFPLEHWSIAVRTTPGSWGDREMWVRYEGTWTEEEREAAAQKRRQQQVWRRQVSTRRKQAKEAAAKATIRDMSIKRGGSNRS